MADWNAYHRQAKIEGLRRARAIAEQTRELSRGENQLEHGQRRACTRIIQMIDRTIDDMEAAGRHQVYTHFMEEPRDD